MTSKVAKVVDWFRNRRSDFWALRSAWWQRRVLNRIRSRPPGSKIRVLFYVYDAAKWKCQGVYDMMAESADFEPLVAIGQSPYNPVSKSPETSEAALRGLERQFAAYGCKTVRVVRGFPIRFDDLRKLRPDIVFLQQPWSLPQEYCPHSISEFALPMYVPYYVDVGFDYDLDVRDDFFRGLRAHFVLTPGWAKALRDVHRGIASAVEFVATGHPSLDDISGIRRGARQDGKVKTVIYAPHFSFEHPNIRRILNIGTFSWNGMQILDYAKAHREFDWIFKPHPALMDNLSRPDVLGADGAKAYYDEWRKIGKVELGGNYASLFDEADAMVTDCGSFLAEFGATGKPIVYLVRSHPDAQMPNAPNRYFDSYYKARNLEEMYEAFKSVLEESRDPKREERRKAVEAAGLMMDDAAKRIVEWLRKLCANA